MTLLRVCLRARESLAGSPWSRVIHINQTARTAISTSHSLYSCNMAAPTHTTALNHKRAVFLAYRPRVDGMAT